MAKISKKEAKERATRTKEARLLAGFKRIKDFSLAHPEVPEQSMKMWESGANSYLTEKSAYRVSEALKKDGLIVSPAWLLYGEPPKPRPADNTTQQHADSRLDNISPLDKLTEYRQHQIIAELNQFLSSNKEAVFIQITDNTLSPALLADDYICGIWIPKEHMAFFCERLCIVELNNGTKLIATVEKKQDQLQAVSNNKILDDSDISRIAAITKILYSTQHILNLKA